jgi:F0F1-type ATP synthase membrane subunit a
MMKFFTTVCLGIAIFAMAALTVAPIVMHADTGTMAGMQECEQGACSFVNECADHCITVLADSNFTMAVFLTIFLFVLTAVVKLTVFPTERQPFFVYKEWFRPLYQFTTVQLRE